MLKGSDQPSSPSLLSATRSAKVWTFLTSIASEALIDLSVKAGSITLRRDAWMLRSVSACRLTGPPAEASMTVYHGALRTFAWRLV